MRRRRTTQDEDIVPCPCGRKITFQEGPGLRLCVVCKTPVDDDEPAACVPWHLYLWRRHGHGLVHMACLEKAQQLMVRRSLTVELDAAT